MSRLVRSSLFVFLLLALLVFNMAWAQRGSGSGGRGGGSGSATGAAGGGGAGASRSSSRTATRGARGQASASVQDEADVAAEDDAGYDDEDADVSVEARNMGNHNNMREAAPFSDFSVRGFYALGALGSSLFTRRDFGTGEVFPLNCSSAVFEDLSLALTGVVCLDGFGGCTVQLFINEAGIERVVASTASTNRLSTLGSFQFGNFRNQPSKDLQCSYKVSPFTGALSLESLLDFTSSSNLALFPAFFDINGVFVSNNEFFFEVNGCDAGLNRLTNSSVINLEQPCFNSNPLDRPVVLIGEAKRQFAQQLVSNTCPKIGTVSRVNVLDVSE